MSGRLPKITALSLMCAAVCAALCLTALAAGENFVSIDSYESAFAEPDGVRMSFSYGFDNVVKSGRMIPLDVDITADDEEAFSGTLSIETGSVIGDGAGGETGARLLYIYPVELAAGESTSISTTISMPSGEGKAFITLRNAQGETLSQGEASVDIPDTQGASVLVGLLSDHPDKLEYFKNVHISGTSLSTQTVELDPENLPALASGYEQLDILVVSSLSASRISSQALEAIEQWVTGGGVIIIGTGDSTEDAYIFARNVDELSVTPLGDTLVNMGLRYSKTDDPDGATISLELAEVYAADGLELMQTDDVTMLTRVQHMNGVVAITAYDLCDLAGFSAEESGYTEDILAGVLGTARIGALSSDMDSSEEYYLLAGDIVGLSDTPRLGVLLLYILLGAAFAVGIVALSLYLRARGLAVFYHLFVLMAAALAAALMCLMAVAVRDTGIGINYAFVREIGEDYTSESGFLLSAAGENTAYTLYYPDGYELYPICYRLDTDEEGAIVELRSGSVSVSAARPFSTLTSEFVRSISPEETGAVEASIHYFDGQMSLEISNNFDFPLEDASLILYGEMLKVGDIEAHGSISLDDVSTSTIPVGHATVAAELLTDDSGSILGLRRRRLLAYYLDNSLNYNFDGVRLLAFSSSDEAAPLIDSDKRLSISGDMLLAATLDCDYTDGIYISRNCLLSEPALISGDYDFVTNTVTASSVLEYALGSGMSIRSLELRSLKGDGSEGITVFDGGISFYNYETSSYDYIGSGEAELDEDELACYLSPANTITVRYSPSDQQRGLEMYLPVPYCIGVPGDYNA